MRQYVVALASSVFMVCLLAAGAFLSTGCSSASDPGPGFTTPDATTPGVDAIGPGEDSTGTTDEDDSSGAPDDATHGKDSDNVAGDDAGGDVVGEDAVDPVDDTTDPVDDATDPVDDSSDPVDDSTDPVDDSTDPVDDSSDPVDDTADPVADVVDPIDDSGPTEDTADPVEDVVIPGCEDPPPNACEALGDRRCSPADATVIAEECLLIGACLEWVEVEYCDLPNACTGNVDICSDGQCVADGDPTGGCPQPEGQCQEAYCDPSDGSCSVQDVEPFSPCDDGDICTINDFCFGDSCTGEFEQFGQPVCPKSCNADVGLTCDSFGPLPAAWMVLGDSPGTSNLDGYDCGDLYGDSTGYEHAFILESDFTDGPVTIGVELADPTLAGIAFADVFVLQNVTNVSQCHPDACVAGAAMDDSGRVQLEVPIAPGEQYIVVVDGRDDFEGAVRVAAKCHPSNIELFCTDGENDNNDSWTDCGDDASDADASCLGSLICDHEHACGDSLDNDGDGATDCSDPDCSITADCIIETDCVNGIDDDNNGLTDCGDPDCEFSPDCSGDSCEDATPLSCGLQLVAESTSVGTAEFLEFPQGCNLSLNPDAPGESYPSPGALYHLQADVGCAARVIVDPTSVSSVLDIFAMAPGCTSDHCLVIEADGNWDCVGPGDPDTPGSAFGGVGCIQVPQTYAGSAWIAVMAWGGGAADYDLEVDCICD